MSEVKSETVQLKGCSVLVHRLTNDAMEKYGHAVPRDIIMKDSSDDDMVLRSPALKMPKLEFCGSPSQSKRHLELFDLFGPKTFHADENQSKMKKIRSSLKPDRTPKYSSSSMPDLDNFSHSNKLNFSWGREKIQKKSTKKRAMVHFGTQTEARLKKPTHFEQNLDFKQCIKEALEDINIENMSGNLSQPPVFNFYFVNPSPLFKKSKNRNSHIKSESCVEGKSKSKVPTGTKDAKPQPQAETEPEIPQKVASTSHFEPLEELGIEAMFSVPAFNLELGSTENQSLSPTNLIEGGVEQLMEPPFQSGTENCHEVDEFADKSVTKLSEEDKRMFYLNQLDRQNLEYMHLRSLDEEKSISWLQDESEEIAVGKALTDDSNLREDEDAPIPNTLYISVETEKVTTKVIDGARDFSTELNDLEKDSGSLENDSEDDDAISLTAGSMRSLSFSPIPKENENAIGEVTEDINNTVCRKSASPKPAVDLLQKPPAFPSQQFGFASRHNREQFIVSPQIIPEEPYVQKFFAHFCKNFILRGVCGYRCTDFKCYDRMSTFNIPKFQQDLKCLSPSSIVKMFAFIKTSACLFNFFFPSFAEALGTRGFVKEIIEAIKITEQENFSLKNYKWVVQGLIKARMAPESAIQLLLKNKNARSVEALEIILKIVNGTKLFGRFFFLVQECANTAGFLFQPEWVNSIYSYLLTQPLNNDLLALLANICINKMTEHGRQSLNPPLTKFMKACLLSSQKKEVFVQKRVPNERGDESKEIKERPFQVPRNLTLNFK